MKDDQNSCECLKFDHLDIISHVNHNQKVGIDSAIVYMGIRTI